MNDDLKLREVVKKHTYFTGASSKALVTAGSMYYNTPSKLVSSSLYGLFSTISNIPNLELNEVMESKVFKCHKSRVVGFTGGLHFDGTPIKHKPTNWNSTLFTVDDLNPSLSEHVANFTLWLSSDESFYEDSPSRCKELSVLLTVLKDKEIYMEGEEALTTGLYLIKLPYSNYYTGDECLGNYTHVGVEALKLDVLLYNWLYPKVTTSLHLPDENGNYTPPIDDYTVSLLSKMMECRVESNLVYYLSLLLFIYGKEMDEATTWFIHFLEEVVDLEKPCGIYLEGGIKGLIIEMNDYFKLLGLEDIIEGDVDFIDDPSIKIPASLSQVIDGIKIVISKYISKEHQGKIDRLLV